MLPRRPMLAAALAGACALGGCGAAGNLPTTGSLRSQFARQSPRVTGIVTELRATLAGAGPHPDALIANQFSALAARAETEAGTVESLVHPTDYNTRLRDLGSALLSVADNLGHLSVAATNHDGHGATAYERMLRADAGQVDGARANVARGLGLHTG